MSRRAHVLLSPTIFGLSPTPFGEVGCQVRQIGDGRVQRDARLTSGKDVVGVSKAGSDENCTEEP